MSEMQMRYDANKKSLFVAYLLWFFLGGFGAHRFYLGAKTSGLVMLLLMLVGVITYVVLVGALFMGVVGVWWVIDAFLIPGLASRYNNDLIDRLRG